MKRSIMSLLLLGAILLISAQEIPLRKAWNVDWKAKQVRTTDDCVIALWEDTDAGDTDIFAQKINASGIEQWPQPIILAGGPGVQEIIACTSTSDNNFVFLYETSGHGYQPGFFIQKVTSHGQVLWGEKGVQFLPENDYFSDIALLANQMGGAYVVYSKYFLNRTIVGHNLDSFGNHLWPAEGTVLVNHNDYLYLDGIVSDGQGGFILHYNKQAGTHRITELIRFSAEGTVIGNNPMFPPTAFPGGRYSILQDASGNYVLWNVKYTYTTDLTLYRMDNQGSFLMSFPQVTNLSIWDYSYHPLPCLQTLADGGLMFSYKLDSGQDKKLMLARFDDSYALLWNQPVVQLAGAEQEFAGQAQLAVTPAGGAWLTWMQFEEQFGPKQLRGQYVDPSGIAAWGDEGLAISAFSYELQSPLPLAISDTGLFLWRDKTDTQLSVRRQILDTSGVPALLAGGAPLVSRLAGITRLLEVVAVQDKYLVFWSDRRYDWENIYYQLCDTNMNPLLEQQGRPLSPPQNGHVNTVQIENMPDGKVAILYHPTYDGEDSPSYVQMIDSSGNKIYPGMGIVLCEDDESTQYAQMSRSGDDLYFAWTSGEYPQRTLKGQRISNGQLMWGQQGKVLFSDLDTSGKSLMKLSNRYIVFDIHAHDLSFLKSHVLRIDPNGDPEAAWPAEGIELMIDAEVSYRWVYTTALLDDDLVAFSTAEPTGEFRAQRISAEGTRLWTDAGMLLPPYHIIDIMEDEALTLVYEVGYELSDLRLQKLAGDGSLMYPENGILIAQDIRYLSDAKLAKFANENLVCTWSARPQEHAYRDLFLRHIDSRGTPLGNGPELLCDAWLEQRFVRTVVIGNSAMAAWNDGRAGILDNEDYVNAIYATRIDASPIGVSDPVLPVPPAAVLAQNYPNPFNPETNIAFQLPASGTTSLNVYNMKGQLVRKLYANQPLAAGKHTILWDGCDEQGREVSSGIYLYRLTFADQAITRKMLMAK